MSALPSGVITAVLTPMTGDGRIAHSALAEHSTWLLQHGSDGILLSGTGGEGLSLAVDERIEALRAILDANVPSDTLLMGTGAAALPDAVRLTREATRRKVAGVLVFPPFHYQNIKPEGVFRFYNELIQQVGDDRLRLYFYHFPELSGVPVAFSTIERLRDAYPGQIAGIKDSDGEWDHTEALCRDFSDLQIFSGTERLLLPTLQEGGAGSISATANVTAPLAAEVVSAWRDGTDAESLQKTLTRFRTAFAPLPTIPALKYLLSKRYGEANWKTTRPPLVPLTDDEQRRVDEIERGLRKTIALPGS